MPILVALCLYARLGPIGTLITPVSLPVNIGQAAHPSVLSFLNITYSRKRETKRTDKPNASILTLLVDRDERTSEYAKTNCDSILCGKERRWHVLHLIRVMIEPKYKMHLISSIWRRQYIETSPAGPFIWFGTVRIFVDRDLLHLQSRTKTGRHWMDTIAAF